MRTPTLAAFVMILGLAVGSQPAGAAPAPQVYQTTAWVVGNYTSTPAESQDAFVLRVAEALAAWTDKTGTEACGPIVRTPTGAMQVTLTTEKSQVVCLISVQPPSGDTLTGNTIHSHPTDGGRHKVRLTHNDINALQALGRGDFVASLRGLDIREVDAEPDTFSPDDYAAGPGYLVVGGRLLYQHGPDTAKQMAVLPGISSASLAGAAH